MILLQLFYLGKFNNLIITKLKFVVKNKIKLKL